MAKYTLKHKGSEIDALLTRVENLPEYISSIRMEIVEELPSVNIDTSVIYLKKKNTTTDNKYEEWVYTSNGWELIGTTDIDLTPYATKEYVDHKTYTVIVASASNIVDFNTLTVDGMYLIQNMTNATVKNAPGAIDASQSNTFLEVGHKGDTVFQSIMTISNNGIPYHRQQSNGVWSSWLSTIATSMLRVGTLNTGTSCALPTSDNHIANKKYVDDTVSNSISTQITNVLGGSY